MKLPVDILCKHQKLFKFRINVQRTWYKPHIYQNVTFRGLCIVIYSYNKSQRDALFLKFILVKNTTCFGQIYYPSSGALILYSHQLVFVILVMLTVYSRGQDGQSTNTCCCEYSINTPDDGQ